MSRDYSLALFTTHMHSDVRIPQEPEEIHCNTTSNIGLKEDIGLVKA